MRFESVKAHAFGPFRDETLELSPGMNVVYGPNEAGKSSWHAALYAGLCGRRRDRRKDKVAKFVERYRPWDGDTSWDVGAIIELDNGRRVELRHDLAGGVNSSASDVEIAGRDYTNEIMFEGAPDGAQWLGLDRRSFIMTACIRQAEILELLRPPNTLQDALQRAADTTDRDGTASEALVRLRDFHTDFVGSTQAWTKPLRVTEEKVQSAERQLQEAQAAHEAYLTRWVEVDKLDQEARDAERRLGVARAASKEEAAAAAAMRGSAERGSCTPTSLAVLPDVPARMTTLFDRSSALSPRGSSVRASASRRERQYRPWKRGWPRPTFTSP